MNKGKGMLWKAFQIKVGFLIHILETYDGIKPNLYGFFLVENAWRSNQDAECWQVHGEITSNDSKAMALMMMMMMWRNRDVWWEPSRIKLILQTSLTLLIQRLPLDACDLPHFFEGETPILVLIWPVRGGPLPTLWEGALACHQ